jgi:hypothetical protein
MKARIKEVLAVFGSLVWRGFGLFLFILGGSAGVGALATGNPFMGILIAWGTLMVGIIGAIGYAIATTGQASTDTVSAAVNDAVQKVQEERDKA